VTPPIAEPATRLIIKGEGEAGNARKEQRWIGRQVVASSKEGANRFRSCRMTVRGSFLFGTLATVVLASRGPSKSCQQRQPFLAKFVPGPHYNHSSTCHHCTYQFLSLKASATQLNSPLSLNSRPPAAASPAFNYWQSWPVCPSGNPGRTMVNP